VAKSSALKNCLQCNREARAAKRYSSYSIVKRHVEHEPVDVVFRVWPELKSLSGMVGLDVDGYSICTGFDGLYFETRLAVHQAERREWEKAGGSAYGVARYIRQQPEVDDRE